MKFNSKSILLNRGINYHYPVETPSSFKNYKFYPHVLCEAVNKFNKKLDGRSCVTMHFDHVKVDILRLVPTRDDTLAIWLVVREKDVDIFHEKCFTITGDVYFVGDSDVEVDAMVIEDVMFNCTHGIFTKRNN